MIKFSKVWIEADDLTDPRLDRFEAFANWLDAKLNLPAEVSVECTPGHLVPNHFSSDAVGVFMVWDTLTNKPNIRFHVVIALGEPGEDEADQESRLVTLAHELMHVEDFNKLYPGMTPAQAYAADGLFRWSDHADYDGTGDPYEDQTEDRARQLTDEFLHGHTSKWAIKQPPSSPPPPAEQQLEFDPTSYKYVTVYTKSYDDISDEGWHINEHNEEQRIPCDSQGDDPVQAAADIIWGEGLSERDGSECFYDPDGGDQNYRTGVYYEVSACLGGFTSEEVEQVHELLDKKWPRRSASWKLAERQWPPEWLAKARQIRDQMFNQGLWGEDIGFFDQELSQQIEEQLDIEPYSAFSLANEVVYELQHAILQKPIGLDVRDIDQEERQIDWDGEHTIPPQAWKNIGPYYGAAGRIEELFPVGSLVEVAEGAWKGQVAQVTGVAERSGMVYVQANNAEMNEWFGRPYGNLQFFWSDLIPAPHMFLQDPPEPRRWKPSSIEDSKKILRFYVGCPVMITGGDWAGYEGTVYSLEHWRNNLVLVELDDGERELFDPQVLQSLGLQPQREIREKPRRWKPSHVFDPKQVTLDPLVFDHEDKLLPRLQKFIQQEVEELFGKHTGMGHQYFNAYLSGPVATYRYNPLGDADLYIVPTYQQLPAHTDPEELRKHLQQKAAEHLDGTHLPGTRHRLHAIVVKPGGSDFQLFNDQDRPAWDFSKQDWLVRPQRHHADESNALNHHLQRAHEIKDKLESLDPASRREYKLYLKQRSDEEPNVYSTPTMIFRFLTDQKLAASPEVQQQAQQTMDSIKNSPAFQQLYQANPDSQKTVDAFTNHLVNRDPHLHPLYWHGIHDVAQGVNPMNTTLRMRRLHGTVEGWRDQGQLPSDFDYNDHPHLDSLQLFTHNHSQEVEKMNQQQGPTVYEFPDGWHIDLVHPSEEPQTGLEHGENVSYYLRDEDNDVRASINFEGHNYDPEIHGPDIWRPHTLHPGANGDGSWYIDSILQENKSKANLAHPWEDDPNTQDHIREWAQHMRQWGQKFDPENVRDEVPYIRSAKELYEWWEENVEGREKYHDPSDPHEFDDPKAPQTDGSWDELIESCIQAILSAHDYGSYGRESVSDEDGLAEALITLWKLDPEGTSLSHLTQVADETLNENFDEWLAQNYSLFMNDVHDTLKEDFRDWMPKELIYRLEEANESDNEDGGTEFDDLFEEIWAQEIQPGHEHEDVFYNVEEKVRDEWWRDGPYHAASTFCQKLYQASEAAPKHSTWKQSDEKFKVIYDFDGDRITLGTLADVQGNSKILGEYDGKSVTLDQPTDSWLNKDYFTRLWEFSFPDRKLENVHIDVTVPKRATKLPYGSPDPGQPPQGQFVVRPPKVGDNFTLFFDDEPHTRDVRVTDMRAAGPHMMGDDGIGYSFTWENYREGILEGWLIDHQDVDSDGLFVPDTTEDYRNEWGWGYLNHHGAKQPFNSPDMSQHSGEFELPEPMQLMLAAGEDLNAEPGSIEIINHSLHYDDDHYGATHWARLFYTWKTPPPWEPYGADREAFVRHLLSEGYDAPGEAEDMADEKLEQWAYNKSKNDSRQKAADYFYYPGHGWECGAS